MYSIDRKSKEKEGTTAVPVNIFRDRTLAPLEAISMHLKDNSGMSYHEIAMLLNRDDRTIWTCYNRGMKKLADRPAKILADKKTKQTKPAKKRTD